MKVLEILPLLVVVCYCGAVSFENCPDDEFKKVGCFKRSEDLFHDMIVTDLDSTHHEWGQEIDWVNFGQSLHSLTCRCSAKARGKYNFFAIGFYGECWAGLNTKAIRDTLYKAGHHTSDQCVGGDYNPCDKGSNDACAGTADNEYVYEIVVDLRCNGIDNGCCTQDAPCLEGDGDCDVDVHCAQGLKCGSKNCHWGGDDDCCFNADYSPRSPVNFWPFLREALVRPAAARRLTHTDLRCGGVNSGCCRKNDTCAEGDGSCDNDEDCAKGLRCGTNNCSWEGKDDCCYKVNEDLRCNGINNGCCTNANPCLEYDGDCDHDMECAKGLRCGTDNCAWGGTDDCCYK